MKALYLFVTAGMALIVSAPSCAQDMASMAMSVPMLNGALGGYTMMRDSSGTSWQPDSTPMEGWSGQVSGWSAMRHGYADIVYDNQGGPRGAEKTFSESMLMAMAQRPLFSGTLTLHAMLSLDPLMGREGYPLLLQTGETANGTTPLTDRQHPHDFFMELAGIYSAPLSSDVSGFLYAGYPGEPALGPPAFMHRFSGMDDPAAPITHHWLDSTHITFGVVTAGVVAGDWKLEASAFNGREPDQFRWGFDSARLDSASVRVSWNPASNWALQTSYGVIKSPEELEPDVNQHRITVSAMYNLPLAVGNFDATVAWGRNMDQPGNMLDALLVEAAFNWDRSTVFARTENVQKDDLVQPPDPLAGQVFRVFEVSLGYVYDIPVAEHVAFGLGAMGTVDGIPGALKQTYGSSPLSYMLFSRIRVI